MKLQRLFVVLLCGSTHVSGYWHNTTTTAGYAIKNGREQRKQKK